MTAERNFAQTLPDCEALVEYLQDRVDFDWEPFLSNKAKRLADFEAQLQSAKDHDMSQWMIRLLEWAVSREARKI